jgi:phosphate transport system substrate-binding protein
VHNDPTAISFSFQKVVDSAKLDVKVLPIAVKSGTPFIAPSVKSFHDDTYPLNNSVFLYVHRPPGTALPPRVKEFLRFVLSREGQEIVAKDRMWIPLSAESAAKELRKLD